MQQCLALYNRSKYDRATRLEGNFNSAKDTQTTLASMPSTNQDHDDGPFEKEEDDLVENDGWSSKKPFNAFGITLLGIRQTLPVEQRFATRHHPTTTLVHEDTTTNSFICKMKAILLVIGLLRCIMRDLPFNRAKPHPPELP